MPATEQYWRNLSTMHKMFAGSSIALLVAVVLMMAKDQQRDWRYYQSEAMRLRQERFRQSADSLKTEEFMQRLGELELRVAEAEAALLGESARRDELQSEIDDLASQVVLAARTTKFQLAEVGKARADYDLAVRDNRPAAEQQRLLDIFTRHEELARQYALDQQELETLLEDRQSALRELTREYDEALAELNAHRADLALMEEQIEALHPNWVRSVKEWPIINAFNPNLRILYDWPGREQINTVQRLPIQLGMARVDRVDRCRTCHVNVAEFGRGNVPLFPRGEPEEGGYPLPFASHPRPDLYLTAASPHPIEEFGCTICHGGDGSGTSFQHAEHTPSDPAQARRWHEEFGWHSNHFWEYPMHPGTFIESSCLQCHHSVVELGNHPQFGPTAPKLYEGYRLISEYGCFGCHEINGYNGITQIGPDLRLEPQTEEEAFALANDPNQVAGTMRKVGPSLRHIGLKTTAEFIAFWTRQPSAFRPSTRMPQFFDLYDHLDVVDHHDALSAQIQPVELAGITAYLLEKSEEMEALHPRAGYVPDPQRGRVEFRRCLACHQYNDGEYAGTTSDFGPDLTNIHEKIPRLNAAGEGIDGFTWLYTWLRDPERYHPRTRMPYQFLEPTGEGEEHVDLAADITSFLLREGPREFPVVELPPPSLGLIVQGVESGLRVTEVLQGTPATRALDVQSRNRSRPVTLLVDDVLLSLNGNPATPAAWATLSESLQLGTEVSIEVRRGGSTLSLVLTASDPLRDLARLYLSKALDPVSAERVLNERRMLVSPSAYQPNEQGELPAITNFIRGDEIELVAATADASFTEEEWQERLLSYIGRRTISRYGCYGCHDIPGFETARPIGTALQDWGVKDTSKLALEHIEEYLHHHHEADGRTTAERMHDIVRRHYFDGNVSQHERTQAMFYESLLHHGRPGFLWQKLRDPRSYDFAKLETKGWDERLRMPLFPFDESQIEAIATFVLGLTADPPPEAYLFRPQGADLVRIEGERLLEKYNCTSCHMLEMPGIRYQIDVTQDIGLTRDQLVAWLRGNSSALGTLEHVQDVIMGRASSSDGTEISEDQKQAVLSGLNWSLPGVSGTPDQQQAHVLRHLRIFLQNGEYLFADRLDGQDATRDYLPFLARLAGMRNGRPLEDWFTSHPESLILDPIPGTDHPAAFPLLFELKPATRFGQLVGDGRATVDAHGLVFQEPDPLEDLEFQEYSFDLWETLEVGGRYRLPGAKANIPVTDIVEHIPHRGGDYALWLVSHLQEHAPQVQGNRNMAWQAAPPPLFQQGIKVQTPWLYEFLRNPEQLRFTTVLRMPRFNMSSEEAQILANYFAAVDGSPYPYQSVPQQRPEYRAGRQEWFVAAHPGLGEDYQLQAWQTLNAPLCIKCHSVGGREYQGTDPIQDIRGPNLDRVPRRLQSDWVQLWLYKPQWITSYTSMPTPYPRNQQTMPELFGGDPTAQTQAIGDALMDYAHLIERFGPLAYDPGEQEDPSGEVPPAVEAAPGAEGIPAAQTVPEIEARPATEGTPTVLLESGAGSTGEE